MYYNSHSDKAHKAVFTPACMRVYDRACPGRCAAGHAECTLMFISKYHRQACWTAWWENGITAICSSAACCAPSLWFLQLHISISRTHAACHLVVCKGIWPSEMVGHVTEKQLLERGQMSVYLVTTLLFYLSVDLRINRTQNLSVLNLMTLLWLAELWLVWSALPKLGSQLSLLFLRP